MDLGSVANSIITSRLWVKGCEEVISFEDDSSSWTFYYCIEGTDCKFWTLCFYNSKLHRIYIRNEIIDLKLENVIIQTAPYVSNIYAMMLECLSSTALWKPKSDVRAQPRMGDDAMSSKKCMSALSILKCAEEEYACAPPILKHDSFVDLISEQTQESPY